MLFSLYSPKGTYDALFLANYAYININDPMTRVPGVGQVQIFGAGQYAMRIWVKPDTLAKLGITVTEIVDAHRRSRTRSTRPARSAASRCRPGQEFTYTVRAQGRLTTPEEFGDIVVRANADGSVVRVRDVARVELGAQTYSMIGRLNGEPAAIIAVYQLPGSNALDTVQRAQGADGGGEDALPGRPRLRRSRSTPRWRSREGIEEIVKTLFEALVLVILVVFIFLQGLRATLIPLLAVPVSLVGTFAVFPLLGLLHQHAVAVRPGAGDRPGGRRRHRRRRGGRAPHRAGAVAARRRPQGHGGGLRAGGRHRPDPGGRVRADRLHSRHHRPALPAVRGHHRGLGDHLGLQRADAQPGAGGAAAAAAEGGARAAGRVLPLVQPRASAAPPTATSAGAGA